MEIEKQEKLLTGNFLILWQGQLVSTLGDAAYSIALGFWILAVTGSTALMGTLMAASTLPGVLVSPFAGVLVDRSDRKRLMVLMDMVRGLCIVLVAGAAYRGFLEVWMVFVAGVILSICGAVFRPGVNSAMPDLVPKSRITGANSLFSIAATGSNMLGNVAGGIIFQQLGAPFLFLVNGLSYLFSGASVCFVKIPKSEKKSEKLFFHDMKEGFQFMWKLRGLRYLLLVASGINFFAFVAIVLFLPLFQRSPELGASSYGVAMACFMGGEMAGYLISSFAQIPPKKKMLFFVASNTLSSVAVIVALNQHIFPVMAVFLAVGGVLNAIVNVTVLSTVQLATPSEMRGKVMAFMSMCTQGLTPFAMALGGVLAGFLSIRGIISVSFLLVILCVLPFCFVRSFIKFLNYDYKTDNLEDLT